MKIISIKDRVNLEMQYDEISMISSALGVPNKAFAAPDFEIKVGVSQSRIDELGSRLWLMVEKKEDYFEYHQLALKANSRQETRKFSLEVSLSKNDIVVLAKAFKEASYFTKEKDDFHTMTGYDWADAVDLQKEFDELLEKIS